MPELRAVLPPCLISSPSATPKPQQPAPADTPPPPLANNRKQYELYDPCCVIWFFRNKLIQIDTGSGNNNKVMRALPKDDMIELTELVYRGAIKGRGLVVANKDYSSSHKY